MNYSYFIPIIAILLIVFITERNQKRAILKKLIHKRGTEDRIQMLELAKRFIDKECIIYTFNGQIIGTVKEISDGAILLAGKDSEEAINIDFVVRIRVYPKSKKGKKKSVIFD